MERINFQYTIFPACRQAGRNLQSIYNFQLVKQIENCFIENSLEIDH